MSDDDQKISKGKVLILVVVCFRCISVSSWFGRPGLDPAGDLYSTAHPGSRLPYGQGVSGQIIVKYFSVTNHLTM